MIRIILILITVLFSFLTNAQEVEGQWNGVLKVADNQLNIVININKTASGYASTMDSPDQGAKGIPVTTTTFENSILKFEIPMAQISYTGTLNKDNVIVGNFVQRGQSLGLNFSKGMAQKQVYARPQEPKAPFSYYTEEVRFQNIKDNVTLTGTLSLPSKTGNFPAVILVSGSGPQNQDGEILGHKMFLVLSDYLVKKGFAVLRFDDRGIGKSTGSFKNAITTDFAKDVQAGVDYLKTRKEINKNKIGLIGHSEGGIVAPIVAGGSKDIDFIVLLAGPGLRGDALLLLQKEIIERQSGVSEIDIKKGQEIFKGAYDLALASSSNDENFKSEIDNYLKSKLDDNQAKSLTAQITNKWFYNFIKTDPVQFLEKVKCPILALNGSKDLQVPAMVNLELIKKTLTTSGNKKVTTKELPNLNHLFQDCKTGLPNEYEKIEQTFSPLALEEISNWILLQTK